MRLPDLACMASARARTHKVEHHFEKAGLCRPRLAAEDLPQALSTSSSRALLGSSENSQ